MGIAPPWLTRCTRVTTWPRFRITTRYPTTNLLTAHGLLHGIRTEYTHHLTIGEKKKKRERERRKEEE
jgi:hypothetical protein